MRFMGLLVLLVSLCMFGLVHVAAFLIVLIIVCNLIFS
jgi:hypothetical protein